MKIDIEKLGYRWRGDYNSNGLIPSLVKYAKNDVVRKDGKVVFYNGNGWTQMASDQLDASVRGELLTAGGELLGADGQELTVRADGTLEWQYTEGRRSTAAVRLPEMRWGGDCYASGGFQNYAIMSDGTVKCWGNQTHGIGDGVVGSRTASLPRIVGFPPGTPPIVRMWRGWYSAFAVDSQGQLWAWGHNNYGQLGVGNTTSQGVPVLVNGRGDLPANAVVVDVATADGYYGYYFTMVRTIDGRCYHMGYNGYRVSGDNTGSTSNNLTPKLIRRSLDIDVEYMIGMGHLYASSWLIDRDGRAWGAGETNSIGRLQNNDSTANMHQLWNASEYDPIKVIYGEESDEHVNAGSQYYRQFLAISRAGNVYSWGQGSTYSSSTNVISPPGAETWVPTYDPRISNVVDGGCSGGWYHTTVVIKSDGTAHYIGGNQYYVGSGNATGSTVSTWTPANFNGVTPNLSRIFFRGSRYGKSCSGITTDGKWLHWGNNNYGASGDGSTGNGSQTKSYALLPAPIQQAYLSGYTTDDQAYLTVTAITGDGNVYAWGYNANGECGMDDDLESVYVPTPVLL